MVQLLEGINFPQAVVRLLDFKNQPFTLSSKPFLSATYTPKAAPENAKTTFPFQNPILINYIQERAIPISLGKKYLYEVLIKSKGKTYYTLGFRNDSNGFALRNRYFKGCQGIQDITTLDMESRKSVAVFEGFFDFLSALVFYGLEEPRMPTVILNTTSNRKKAVSYLSQFNQVNCFFDRDKTGLDCARLLNERDGLNVKDFSHIYEGYNDFNEFLMKNLPSKPVFEKPAKSHK